MPNWCKGTLRVRGKKKNVIAYHIQIYKELK